MFQSDSRLYEERKHKHTASFIVILYFSANLKISSIV